MKIFLNLVLFANLAGAFCPVHMATRTSSKPFRPSVYYSAITTPETTEITPDAKPCNVYCIPLEQVSLSDLPKVGGKTASLGEMIQQLEPYGVDIPGGFAVSSAAYDAVLDRYELRERLRLLLQDLDGKFGSLASHYSSCFV